MPSTIQKNIAGYMNALAPNRTYTAYEVSMIACAIKVEYARRKASGVQVNTRSKEGKVLLNNRIADIVNENNPKIKITAGDVHKYKKCWAEEYMARTKKCVWGYHSTRTKLGFDPVTGKEII